MLKTTFINRSAEPPVQEQQREVNPTIQELPLSTALYKIMSLDRFLQVLITKTNTLIRPSSWQDPYEAKLEKSDLTIPGRHVIRYEGSPWYGQCWTKERECDGLWRNFTNATNTRSVKLKTSVARLCNSLKRINQNEDVEYFLSSVEYSQPELFERTLIKQIEKFQEFRDDFSRSFQLSLLLTKRSAFSYEKEVRLLAYLPNRDVGNPLPFISYPINARKFLMGIELDPWTSEDELPAFKALFERFGINPNNVTRSRLYEKDTEGYHPQIQIQL